MTRRTGVRWHFPFFGRLFNFGEPIRVTYMLAQGKDGWRITDARSGKDTLRAELKRASKR